MKYLLGLWVCCHMAFIGFSQTLTIKDVNTSEPIAYANLISKTPPATATTDLHGQADISKFEGSKDIQIQMLGYQTIHTSFEALQKAGFVLYLTPAEFTREVVIVSATRWRQSSRNTPAKISSISADQVNLQNPQTAADLLELSGKVFIQKSQQGGGSPMIRGFASNRLLYAVDGIRMNTAIFRSGNIQNVINLDPFALERTEVLFGPGSVLYGSDAIGGVMSFHTLTPRFSETDSVVTSGKALTRFASANNQQTGHFDINIGWENWASTTSLSYWDYGHLKQGQHGPDDYLKPWFVRRQDSTDVIIQQEDRLAQIPSGYSQLNLMQKLRFQSNKWDIQYGFHFSKTSSYGRYDRHNRMQNGLPIYAEWKYGPQQWMMNNLTASYRNKSHLFDELTLRLAHQSFEESRISRNFNDPVREIRTENVEAWSANLDFKRNFQNRHTLYYGLEYILNNVTSDGKRENITSDTEMNGPTRYPQADWQSMAGYLNYEFNTYQDWTFQAGLRYNHFILDADFSKNLPFYPLPFEEADLNSGALTGSLGAVFRPNNQWVVRANAGTAFRSPNVDDIGKVFDSEPGSVVVPNTDLEAEYAWNLDLGITKIFDDAVRLDITGFYTSLDNAMVRRNFQLNGQDSIVYEGILSQVQAIQNAATANVWGVQTGLEIRLPGGFRLSSDLNYQEGEEELDEGTTSPSRHAAPLFGVTRISYTNDKLDLQLYAQYQGERSHDELSVSERSKKEIYALDENGNTYAPGWYTINLKALYQLNETFQLSAGLENITDQRYRPYSSGISGPGRNFVLSLSAKW